MSSKLFLIFKIWEVDRGNCLWRAICLCLFQMLASSYWDHSQIFLQLQDKYFHTSFIQNILSSNMNKITFNLVFAPLYILHIACNSSRSGGFPSIEQVIKLGEEDLMRWNKTGKIVQAFLRKWYTCLWSIEVIKTFNLKILISTNLDNSEDLQFAVSLSDCTLKTRDAKSVLKFPRTRSVGDTQLTQAFKVETSTQAAGLQS